MTIPAERIDGTVGANVAALANGARLFRVHDVRPHRHALDVAWAILRAEVMSILEQLRLLHPGWRDALEIAIVSVAIYRVLLLIHRTRAMQVLAGIIVLAVAFGLAYLLQLSMIVYLLKLIFSYGAIALLVVFAPELRAALAQIGRSPMSRFFTHMGESEIADEIAEAVERLSRSGIGAIVTIEREVSLEEYISSGSRMQAKVSADLLATIFTPYSPLHDGAVIIRGDTIVGAGCILPLPQMAIVDRSLGTRHRAALGLSEETDALVVVVSEETATITLATNGRAVARLDAAPGPRGRRRPTDSRDLEGIGDRHQLVTPRRSAWCAGAADARGLRRDVGAERDVLGLGRIHRRGANARDSASARDAAVRPAAQCLGAAAAVSPVRRRHESALGGVHGAGGRAHRGVARRECAAHRSPRLPRSAPARWSPSGRTRPRPRYTRPRSLSPIATIVCADQFGRSAEPRWLVLTSYLLALAIPLHASALVAAPVVIYLATARAGSHPAVARTTGAPAQPPPASRYARSD